MVVGRKRNIACEESRGDIIVHWDDDDWYAPDGSVSRRIPFLKNTADYACPLPYDQALITPPILFSGKAFVRMGTPLSCRAQGYQRGELFGCGDLMITPPILFNGSASFEWAPLFPATAPGQPKRGAFWVW
ncbi:MAG: glycosyltransferase family 2 protein [Bacteroidetes bacterium]|nr:glycosyltransferase family 2 protein [Bacteroidota bacterium]